VNGGSAPDQDTGIWAASRGNANVRSNALRGLTAAVEHGRQGVLDVRPLTGYPRSCDQVSFMLLMKSTVSASRWS